MSVPHIIASAWLSLCQKLSNLVEIWRNSDNSKLHHLFGRPCILQTTAGLKHKNTKLKVKVNDTQDTCNKAKSVKSDKKTFHVMSCPCFYSSYGQA